RAEGATDRAAVLHVAGSQRVVLEAADRAYASGIEMLEEGQARAFGAGLLRPDGAGIVDKRRAVPNGDRIAIAVAVADVAAGQDGQPGVDRKVSPEAVVQLVVLLCGSRQDDLGADLLEGTA